MRGANCDDYRVEKGKIYQDVLKKLHSRGKTGLSDVLKIALALFNYRYSKELGGTQHQGIERFLHQLFPKTREYSNISYLVPRFYNKRLLDLLDFVLGWKWPYRLTSTGDLYWHHCRLIAPSATEQFEDYGLFNDFWLASAVSHFDNGDISKAKEVLHQGLGQSINVPPVFLFTLIYIYGDDGLPREFIQTLTIALVHDPFDRRLRIGLRAAYKREIKLSPRDIVASNQSELELCSWVCWGCLGDVYLELHQYHDAIIAFLTAVQINPSVAAIEYLRQVGRMYGDGSLSDENQFGKYARLVAKQDDSECWYHLGNEYEKRGQLEKAIHASRKSLEYYKGIRKNPLYFRLAELYCANGDHVHSKKVLRYHRDKVFPF